MYAGFITPKYTLNILGVHQKFNKAAYRKVRPYIDMQAFPKLKAIQHFEGYNGPDGIKVKSPHRHDEPSHFYDPEQGDGPLIEHLLEHYKLLVEALEDQDKVRSAFEASWLAHVLVDGLTPAHHYPYEQELELMYRTSQQKFYKRRHKILLQGINKRQLLKGNWRMWGNKGLLSTHIHFEAGVAAAVITGNFDTKLDEEKLSEARVLGLLEFFKQEAAKVHEMKMYDLFYQTSWTVKLARMSRKYLAPQIIEALAVIWILAAEEAGVAGVNKL